MATISDVTATTMVIRSKQLYDNVTDNNQLLKHLGTKGMDNTLTGGESIYEVLGYSNNDTFLFYNETEPLNYEQSHDITAAKFDWCQAAMAVVISGAQALKNAGSAQAHNLLTGMIENCMEGFANNMDEALYSDGSAFNGSQVDGLAVAVQTNPAGLYGGINRNVEDWWKNYAKTGLSFGTGADVEQHMMTGWSDAQSMKSKPDLVIADSARYQLYWRHVSDRQRQIGIPKKGGTGMEELVFVDAPFVNGGGLGNHLNAQRIYMLTKKYLKFKSHKKRNMRAMPVRYPVGQDAEIHYVMWAGNLCCGNSRVQIVLSN